MTFLRGLSLSAAAVVLAGCAFQPAEVMRQPRLTPLETGMPAAKKAVATTSEPPAVRLTSDHSAWHDSAVDLFRDARAMRVGDVITVKISIKDKATIDNSSNRSRDSSSSFAPAMKYGLDTGHFAANGTGSAALSQATKSSSTGKGGVARSESIDLLVAAVVSEVLPNGNLVIKGSQEVRVNFELRELSVTGLVRPRDVSTDNVVSYERIAEARISYGGQGRITEVQQPAWGQQILDAILPF